MTNRTAFMGIVVAALLLCGAGCVSVPALPQERAEGAEDQPAKQAQWRSDEPWHQIADGVEKTVFIDKGTGVGVVLFRFASGQFSTRLLSSPDSPKAVSAWAKSVQGESAVINGTYFNEDYSPSGFVAVEGARIGSRSFDLDKSGLLVFTPRLNIVDTKEDTIELDAASLSDAAQSYPFYIIDGQPAISKDSGQTSRRSFIGQDKQGNTYLGAVPEDFVSLHALMGLLVATDIDWTNVLNLDGGPSTGLYSSFGGKTGGHDSFDDVPNVIVIQRK